MVDLKKLGVIFRREYLERVRSRWFMIGTFLGPVFFAAVTILPVYLTSRQKPAVDLANVFVLDATGTGLGDRVGAALARSFPASRRPRVRKVDPERLAVAQDSAAIEVMRGDGGAKGYFVLDSNTIANRSIYYAGRNASSINDVQAMMVSVRQQVLAQRLVTEGLDPERVNAVTAGKLNVRTEKIGDKGREHGSGVGNLLFGYVVAFLLYMMIMLYGQNILRGVMEEKTTRVAEVVVSSVSPDTLLAGKVFGVGLVAITQVLCWAGLTALLGYYLWPLLQAKMGAGAGAAMASARGVPANALTAALPSVGTALTILAYFVFGFIFYASLFAAVGAMVSSQEDVQQASMPVILLLVSSVVFMQPILLNPGGTMARVMSLIPFSAPILMPLRMSLIAVPWYEVAASLGGVMLACVAAIWVSARIYRVGLLMYGKRPTYRELARWVRQAG
ncbi:MAG: ABC transporter permease [Gemmatimonadaceae bacterium]|nr:ABC transporter permease [Gemmatimonadaceae bacterium]